MAETLRSGAALAVVLALGLAGCGEDAKPAPDAEVRATLTKLEQATAAKDYRALCTEVFAPQLVAQVASIGLPCEQALRRGLEDVREPRLTVGRIRVTGERASAEVATSAAGQEPSRDVVELVRVKEGWRVSSLAGQQPPAPSPSPAP